ncbi:hypothetical protein PMAYCL1PPCAC_00065, partial [Pristionchus mayeri]
MSRLTSSTTWRQLWTRCMRTCSKQRTTSPTWRSAAACADSLGDALFSSDASRTSTVAWRDEENGIVICDQPRVHVGLSPLTPQGGYITRITNDAREDEMDGNLMQVSSIVGTLKSMALDMSAEISRQNRQVDRIGAKAQTNDEHVSAASKKATKLMD